jgi:hypothetical protein
VGADCVGRRERRDRALFLDRLLEVFFRALLVLVFEVFAAEVPEAENPGGTLASRRKADRTAIDLLNCKTQF